MFFFLMGEMMHIRWNVIAISLILLLLHLLLKNKYVPMRNHGTWGCPWFLIGTYLFFNKRWSNNNINDIAMTFHLICIISPIKKKKHRNSLKVAVSIQICRICCVTPTFSPQEVGIITPYAAQARLLRRTLGCPAPGKRGTGGMTVEVSSVDGFQGREKDGWDSWDPRAATDLRLI